MNISIITGVLLGAFSRWLGLRRGTWLASAGIAAYTLLVGADAAVVRAAIMGILALIALQAGRQQLALNTLAISAALMALVNPLLLWDIGFQLSFAATLGLVLYTAPLSRWAHTWLERRTSKAWTNKLRGLLNDYVFMTLAAQLTTLPLLLFYFQRLSLFSLPANLLILPAQPVLMILGGLSLLLGLVVLPVGQVLAALSWGIAAYTIRIVEFFAGLPWSTQTLENFPLVMVFGWYAALVALSFRPWRDWVRQVRDRPAAVLGVLTAACLLIWNAALTAPDGTLQLTLLDVEGEAILIRTPNGRSLLVNGGSSQTQLLDELRRELAWGERLDWLLLSGSQRDQVGAVVSGLERVPARSLAWATEGARLIGVLQQASESQIPATALHTGDSFDLGDNGRLEVLMTDEDGAVLFLEWQDFNALLPIGVSPYQLADLVENRTPVDLLLLTGDSAMPAWINIATPRIVWMSTEGELPTSTQIVAQGTRVIEASQYSWLRLITDGTDIWLEADH